MPLLADASVAWGIIDSLLSGGLVILLAATGSFLLGQYRGRRRVRKELDQRLTRIENSVQAVHEAILGRPSSEFEPDPPMGLAGRVGRIESTLFENGGKKNTVLDRLQRIEAAAASSPSQVTVAVTQHTETEGHQ